MVHIDVMDGRFVPNITIGSQMVESLRSRTGLLMDVHLMIVEPEKHIAEFSRAGADLITVHAESSDHLHRLLYSIKECGLRAGLALNPATTEHVLDYLWDLLDLVLVMSVNPGFGGQKFIPAVLPKIRTIARKIKSLGKDIELQVDGGVNRRLPHLLSKPGIGPGHGVGCLRRGKGWPHYSGYQNVARGKRGV